MKKHDGTKHVPFPSLTQKQVDRFWEKVGVTSETSCWIWTGYINKKTGYGQTAFRFKGKLYRVHRVAYFLHHGIDPLKKCVCHNCDNPPCCNPAHLFLGTRKENLEDMTQKGRRKHGHPPNECMPRGENNWKAKLTEEDVHEIRELLWQGIGHRMVAERFKVASSRISDIRNKIAWAHVPERPHAGENKSRKRKEGLTEEIVKEIRKLLRDGLSQREISKATGVHPCTISDINTGKIWSHVIG